METQQIVRNLEALRREIEREADGLTDEQTYLLADVCRALSLTGAQTFTVIGKRYAELVMCPTTYRLTGFPIVVNAMEVAGV